MADVKNVRECLILIKELGKVVKEVAADGKVNVLDLPRIAPLWGPAQAAIRDIQNVMEEIKDVDGAEAKLLLADCVEIVSVWAQVIAPAVVAKAA